jgi:hypothetical protein
MSSTVYTKILHGGIFLLNKPGLLLTYSSILLKKSEVWQEGILHINNAPYFRLLPYKQHYMQVKNINVNNINVNALFVNNRNIYNNPELFYYSIHVKMNEKYLHLENTKELEQFFIQTCP